MNAGGFRRRSGGFGGEWVGTREWGGRREGTAFAA